MRREDELIYIESKLIPDCNLHHRKYTNGDETWHDNEGEFHREGGLPAVNYSNGTKVYYRNGKLHRENDLPAVVHDIRDELYGGSELDINERLEIADIVPLNSNGPDCRNRGMEWYKNGVRHRNGGRPAIVYAGACVNGPHEFYVEGRLHRVDGPAIENCNRRNEWYIDGIRHRIGGPAIEYIDDSNNNEWYENGNLIKK